MNSASVSGNASAKRECEKPGLWTYADLHRPTGDRSGSLGTRQIGCRMDDRLPAPRARWCLAGLGVRAAWMREGWAWEGQPYSVRVAGGRLDGSRPWTALEPKRAGGSPRAVGRWPRKASEMVRQGGGQAGDADCCGGRYTCQMARRASTALRRRVLAESN